MKCPHPIEPHQIQGLDFIHMYPVVQVDINIQTVTKDLYWIQFHIISLSKTIDICSLFSGW